MQEIKLNYQHLLIRLFSGERKCERQNETESQKNADAAVSAVRRCTAECDPDRKLDVTDVKAPVKAINFTDNGGETRSVLRKLL